jgi:uroporphyrinogen decarboxylase
MALDHKEPDRVPRFDSFWSEMIDDYKAHLGLDKSATIIDVNDKFGFDMEMYNLDCSMRFPAKVVEETDEIVIVTDRCGYTARKYKNSPLSEFYDHLNTDYETWQTMKHRFNLDTSDTTRIDNTHTFLRTTPMPAWEESAAKFKNSLSSGRFVAINGYGPYEGTWRHRGYENLLMDLVLDEKYCHEMFSVMMDLTIEVLEYGMSLGIKPDGYFLTDDLGSTRSTLFSPETYRKMIFPYHKQLGDFLHKHGIRYLIHSCGNIESFLPGFIEAGIEAVQPLQANTTMDIAKLKKEYGADITFWGNISAIAMETGFAEIEKEISTKVPLAMKGGGYIYHSDHSVPLDVPFENYEYVIKMLDKYGVYK